MSDDLSKRIQSWLEGPYDTKTQEEIKRLAHADPKGLADAFFKDLSFGTGGMRGIMGVGTNRMNIYTIRRASQGLAQYILKQGRENPSVFIGYDVRNHSRRFAQESARVFAGNGILPLFTKEVCPTPLVSFGCRFYGCSAGVMITASHNPPQYNGYKVYWSDGAQVVFPQDEEIMAEVAAIRTPDQILLKDYWEEIGEEIDEAYLAELKKIELPSRFSKKGVKIIYTNLHGTGIRLIPKALESWGYTNLHFVEKQLSLDGNFPFAPSLNPEEEKALQLGLEQLKEEGGDLLIATDPDADRIGIADRTGRFTGNQIGCLCLHHICKRLKEEGQFPQNGAFIKTIVTSELFRKIGEDYGGKCIDVLTGFKYIGQWIRIWEAAFDGYQYLFGAEESYGYLIGTFVRDKDAVSAACLIAEIGAEAKERGATLLDLLYEIYQKYGIHREALFNFSFPDSRGGMEQMGSVMKKLRESPLREIGNQPVVLFEDYLLGKEGLPPSDVLRFWLKDKSKIVIRPSGTEPKIKIYAEAVEEGGEDLVRKIEQCDERVKKLIGDFIKEAQIGAPS